MEVMDARPRASFGTDTMFSTQEAITFSVVHPTFAMLLHMLHD